MPELPTGTVTFLFTDIEGSTALWEKHRDAMRQALVRHDALVEQIVAEHDGHVVRPRGEGDSRFAVFARASDAVAAAADLQQALHAEPWPTPTPVRVRMALHTGEADLREGDYYGSAVNRCARLRTVAHGGQTLVSQATYDLVRGQIVGGVTLRDLGTHQLKDLQHAEQIFQLLVDGLPVDFPPLQTLHAHPNNLPVQLTSFIGREQAVAAIRARLCDPQVRLLTLTGPGGTGKTRLALQVAAGVLDTFPAGVWFVDLAPVSDSTLVPATIAQTLGVKEAAGQSLRERLTAFLGEQRLLLILDNFEQVLAAAPLVDNLLRSAARLTVVVTSRAVLGLYGEYDVQIPPLALPDRTLPPPVEQLTRYDAVRLFVERAQAAQADFTLRAENAAAVLEICHRLDGLPLAIELAAARVRLLPPAALLHRLTNRLQVLAGGARTLPTRQQTLRATIAWSYQLLSADEQMLFRRLGVFAGGCTLDAAEAVCTAAGDLQLDVLDGLAALVDKSLVRQIAAADEPRFTMLETIRDYALEHLRARAETQDLQRRHAAYYLDLVERGKVVSRRPGFQAWSDRAALEYDNLREAMTWAQAEATSGEVALRLTGGLGDFWSARGQLTEGRGWLERALSRSVAASPARATALCALGRLAWFQGDIAVARSRLNESIALWRQLGEVAGLAEALHLRGHVAYDQGEYALAQACFTESLAAYEGVGAAADILPLLKDLGELAFQQGDAATARQLFEACLARCQALGSEDGIADMLVLLGSLALQAGDYERAGKLFEQGLAQVRALQMRPDVAHALYGLGVVGQYQGNDNQARTYFTESLAIYWKLGYKQHVVMCLARLAGVASVPPVEPPGARRAARLLGATSALLDTLGTVLPVADRVEYERNLATARAQLDAATWATAWAKGQAMTLEQAIDYALEQSESTTTER